MNHHFFIAIYMLMWVSCQGLFGQQLTFSPQTGHSGVINCVAFHPSGDVLLSAGTDQSIVLWDIHAGQQAASFEIHQATINDLVFHPSKNWVASGGEDQSVKIWEFPSGKLIAELDSFDHPIEQLTFSKDGSRLYCVAWDVFEMNMSDFSYQKILEAGDKKYSSLALDPLERYIAVGGRTRKKLELIDLEKKRLLRSYTIKAFDIAFDQDGSFLIAAGRAKFIKVRLDKRSLGRTQTINDPLGWMAYPSVVITDQYVVLSNQNDRILIYDKQTLWKKKEITAHLDEINTLAMSPDRRVVASAGYDHFVVLWDMESLDMIQPFYGFVNQVNAINFTEDGRNLLIGTNRGVLRSWNLQTNRISSRRISPTIASVRGSGFSSIYRINFSIHQIWQEGDDVKFVAFRDREVKNKDSQTRMPLTHSARYIMETKLGLKKNGGKSQFKRDVLRGQWKPDQDKLLMNSDPAFETNPDIQTRQVQDQRNHLQAWVNADNELLLKDSAKLLFTIPTGHIGKVADISIHPKQSILATAGWDGTIKMWDLKTGTLMVNLVAMNDDDFLYLTPENYYYVSKEALEGIGFSWEDRVLSFEQFDVMYNRPDIALATLPFVPDSILTIYRSAYNKRRQKMGFFSGIASNESFNELPRISVLNRRTIPPSTNKRYWTLQIKAQDDQAALKRINILINGVPIQGRKGISIPKTGRREYELEVPITLSQGENRIQVSAINSQGIPSIEERLEITYQEKKTLRNLYVISMGVVNYKDSKQNLEYPAQDAENVIKTFGKQRKKFEHIHSFSLIDQAVSLDTLRKLKKQLLMTDPDDMVVVFYAGHGLRDVNNDYYLGTYDTDFADPAKKGLKYEVLESLLDSIPSRKKLLMIDACHAGEIDRDETMKYQTRNIDKAETDFRNVDLEQQLLLAGKQPVFEFMRSIFADVRRSTGATVLASSRGGELAAEGKVWNGGAFTYCLVEGLEKKKADENEDRVIMLSELQEYLYQRVPELTGGLQTPTTRVENLNNDFRIW